MHMMSLNTTECGIMMQNVSHDQPINLLHPGVCRISYDREFLLSIKSKCTELPPGLEKRFVHTEVTMPVREPTHRVLPQGHQKMHIMSLNTTECGIMQNVSHDQRKKQPINLLHPGVCRISYDREFLLSIKSKCTEPPPGLEKRFVHTEVTMPLNKLVGNRKDKWSGRQGHLGHQAVLRPGWKKNGPSSTQQTLGSIMRGEHMDTAPESGMKSLPMLDSYTPSASEALDIGWSDFYKEEDINSATDESYSTKENEVTYVNTIKAWRPHSLESDRLSVEGDENRALYRKFQGILNKLTPQKFSALSDQALQLEINTAERLRECAEMVLNNVAAGPQLAMIYANLCKRMASIKAKLTSDKEMNFRWMILYKCQRKFEKKYEEERVARIQKEIRRADTKDSLLEEEIELILDKRKKLPLACACFIGELFKLRMLSETFIRECITRPLNSKSDEESLECLARLITITGKELDKGKTKGLVGHWFQHIKTIIQGKKKKNRVCPRVRFILQDVVELREKNWINQAGLTARAMYDYRAEDDDEISFDVNDIITNIEQIGEWWRGTREVDGSNGFFPANYVELI